MDKSSCIRTAASFALSLALFGCDEEKFRKAPLLDTPTEITLNAKDFGAVPDDGKNDFEALAKAVAEIEKRGGKAKLVFEKGVYNIKDDVSKDAEKYIWTLKNSKDVIIDGGGAVFIIENPAYGILDIQSCERVIVKNMAVDYDPIPWTECVIESVDAKNLRVIVSIRKDQYKAVDGKMKSFPQLDHPMFNLNVTGGAEASIWGYQLDPKVPGRLKNMAMRHNMLDEAIKLPDGRFDIKMRGGLQTSYSNYEVGDRFGILARRSNRICLFLTQYSKDVSFIDIDAYASPSFFYKSIHSEFMNFVRCGGLIYPGRWRGGDADFVHLQNNKNGPWIEGCTVEGIADDSLVFYTRPFYLTDSSADGLTFTIKRAIWPKGCEDLIDGDIFVGAPLLFINPMDGSVIGRVEVAHFDKAKSQIKLSSALKIPGELIGTDQKRTQVFNEAFSKNFVVKNNTVRNSRRYGLYWKGSNGLIEGNTFEGLSSDAITLHNEAAAPNGPFCSDVVIRNNTIRDCGFDSAYAVDFASAAISVYSRPTPSRIPSKATGCFRNIVIENNTIENWNLRAIQVLNADGVVVKNNTIGGLMKNGTDKTEGKKVIVESSTNVLTDALGDGER